MDHSSDSMTGQVESLLPVHDGAAAAPPTGAHASGTQFLSLADQTMLMRARKGDARALREFYDGHHDQVRAHLYRLLGPDSELDDVMQTVFARAFTALAEFRGNSTISTWLYRITANTTHNLLRQRYRRDRLQLAFRWFNVSREAHLSSGHVDVRDEAQRLLQRLHPDLREVFVLYYYEGLTLQEISEVLDKPISTLGDRLTRARKRLQRLVHA